MSTDRTMDASVRDGLLEKYRTAERRIARARGPLSLFGLFERQDNPGRLDLVVSAPWLTTDRRGLQDLAKFLPRLTAQESALIGRIVALDPDDEFVRDLNRLVATEGHLRETGGLRAWEVDVRRGYVFTSARRTPDAQGHPPRPFAPPEGAALG